MYMAPHDQEFHSFSAPIPASEMPHYTRIPRLEEFRDDHQPCSSRKVPRTEQGRCIDYYSEDELETADALILLSLSHGGLCVSSSPAPDSTSDINSGDSKSNATETPPVPEISRISRDEKNHLVLRIKLVPSKKPEKQIIAYKCDKCDRELSSPQALGGHKTSHRRKPASVYVVPDLNLPLKVFECSICGDVYDSGQALGGHKRKHHSL